MANSNNEALKKSDDLSKRASNNEWLQNALQKQGQKNQYGAADKLQDAATKKAEDFKTFFDKRDDRIWNGARSSDKAYRGASDNAAKNGLYNKDAIARASGHKGTADNKYYGGADKGSGGGYGGVYGGGNPYSRGGSVGGYGSNRGSPLAYNTAGVEDTDPKVAYAHQGAGSGAIAGVAGPGGPNVRGRLEKSGGEALNAYQEKAIQGDLANHVSNNGAESRANAKNQYLRNTGLEDAIQANAAKQGKWANQREGFRDDRQQGFNNDNANAARAGESIDNAMSDAVKVSSLDSAERGIDQAKLDRINLKKNQVESKQNVRSKKQFYHDKNQGGFNNEGLNYNRNRGNNDFGAQEAAEKEAKTKFSNLHKDSKNSRGQRRFDDVDSRKTSNAESIFKRQNANNGAAAAFARAADQARNQARGFNKQLARREFDKFNQGNNQRNQKRWDNMNRHLFARNNGQNIGRRVDGAFRYQNGAPSYRSDDQLQLGTKSFGYVPQEKIKGNYDPFAPAFNSGRSQPTFQNNKQSIDNVGANIGQTQFGQYW